MQLVPRQPGGRPVLGAPAEQVTEAWLANRRLSEHTRSAYRRDVRGWLDWCAGRDLDPLKATFLDVNAYARELEAVPLAATTVARKLSGVSSWYDFLVKLRALDGNPVSGADRPYVNRDHSATVGLSPGEVDALLARAEVAGERTRAALTLLADLGLRVGELCGLDLGDLGWERGHRTVRFVGKGGRPRRRALTPGATAGTPSSGWCAGWPPRPESRKPTGSPRTRCGTPSPPPPAPRAYRWKTCRTRWVTPTRGPPAATTGTGTTWTATRRTRSPRPAPGAPAADP
jgi:hypothetical protein